MEYQYYIPKKLEGISTLIWEQKTGCPKQWLMLPEFNIDLIFNLEKPWTIHSEYYKGKSYNPTEKFCFLSGLHTKPLYVEFQNCHMFGIRLNTTAASLLFGVDCSELKNWSIDGDYVFAGRLNYIQDKVYSLPDFYNRAKWLEEFIFSLLRQHSDLNTAMKISALLDGLCNKKSSGISFRIEDYTGYSRMHTLRIFQKWFGIPPSEALAFRRFEKAINLIHKTTDSLTQIGLDCGFYDQSHFIRIFRKFAEMPPKQYLKRKTEAVAQLPY
ncbi:AraC family transcriptional regulator [Cyclobacterium plantarum]|nr:helix-turn-helix domain-containing protein [Cyclobacterium plantarum]